MFAGASIRGGGRCFCCSFKRGSLYWFRCQVENFPFVTSSPRTISCSISSTHDMCMHPRNYSLARHISRVASFPSSSDFLFIQRSSKKPDNGNSTTKDKKKRKVKMSRNAKLKELRCYRLKAKMKMNSTSPEVRIRYKLDKAKRKEA